MTDFRALINSVDLSPNAGSTQPRPLARVFAFQTSLPLALIDQNGAIRVAEVRVMDVGDTFEVHGPGYVRFYRLTGKQGEFCQYERIGTEAGPDPDIRGTATVSPGEVYVRVSVPAMVEGSRVEVTPLTCDVSFWITAGEGGFDIDVKTADTVPIEFDWRVTL
jgi:hypothetical protein